MFLECDKCHFGARKGQMVDLGSKTPKTAEMSAKQGATQEDHGCPHHIDWPHMSPKMTMETGEEAPKGQMAPFFTRPQGGGGGSDQGWWGWGLGGCLRVGGRVGLNIFVFGAEMPIKGS